MKKYFYALCMLLACGSTFVACSDDDDPVIVEPKPETKPAIQHVNLTLNFTAPADLAKNEPSVAIESLTLKEINTGVTTPVVVKGSRGEGASITVNVPEGLYTIDMEGVITYNLNGKATYSKLRAFKENVTVTVATAASPVGVEGSLYNEDAGFVIAEIYFTGSATPEGKQYSGDQYFRIYNNSNVELCANGLTIAESEFLTVDKQEYTPNVMNEAFATGAIYRIPVDGEKIMVKPGESLLLVDNAINHKNACSTSFDLSKADFEWFDKNDNPNFQDVDNDKVPNLEKIYCYTKTIWGLHNRGFKSYVLARLGDSEAEQLTAEAFLKDYKYDYSYEFVYPGGVIPMKKSAYKIPNKWVIDAVNLSVESEFKWIVTAPSLDKGWSFCGKVDKDKTRYNKSVRRKVLSGKVLQDTNDSAVDFLPEQAADPYFKFHE